MKLQGSIVSIVPTILELLGSVYAYLGVISTVIGILLTRPRCDPAPGGDYFNDETEKYVQIFTLHLKFAGNPLFPRVKLLEYKGKAKYEISGFEYGSYETSLPSGWFKEKSGSSRIRRAVSWLVKRKSIGDSRTKVYLAERSMIRHRKMSTLIAEIESDGGDYRSHVHFSIQSNRIDITNDNSASVRYFAIPLSVPSFRHSLAGNPNVYDFYKEGGQWIMRVKEVEAKKLGRPGRLAVLF